MLAFTKDDPGAAARVVKKFSKEHEELKAVSLVLDGKLLPATDISKLAELPTQDQARAMLLGILTHLRHSFLDYLMSQPQCYQEQCQQEVMGKFRQEVII